MVRRSRFRPGSSDDEVRTELARCHKVPTARKCKPTRPKCKEMKPSKPKCKAMKSHKAKMQGNEGPTKSSAKMPKWTKIKTPEAKMKGKQGPRVQNERNQPSPGASKNAWV